MPSLRFGKHPPKHDYRTLRFKKYLKKGIAAPPPSLNVLDRVYAKLQQSDPTKLFPMDGNDTLGDCTIAGVAHAVTTYCGLVGKHRVMSRTSVVKLYMHLTGGVDSGLNELDVLNYWRQKKISGDEILAFASIDVKNHTHVMQAIQLFGGVYLGSRCSRTANRSSMRGSLGRQGRSRRTAMRCSLSDTIRTRLLS